MRIEDVDWRSGWVHVQRGLHVVGGEVVETGCKTKLSDRKLKLPRFALDACERYEVPAGLVAYACLTPRRGPQVPRVLQAIRPAPRTDDMPAPQLATISLEHGAAIEDIAVALGHSTVNTAMSHYLQSFRTVVARASDSYTAAMEW